MIMDDYLARIPFFRSLPKAERRRLGGVCDSLRFERGQSVFEEGQPAEFVWVVERGWLYLVKQTVNNGLVTILTMTPDDAICGISAFDHGTYSTGAVAATDSRLLKFPNKAFSALLGRYPRFTKHVLLTLCGRMRHMAESIKMAQSPVEQRLVHVLLLLRKSFGSTVPITHQELARMAGTRWETSIRTLSSLKRRGWISSTRGRVTLLDPQKLRALLNNSTGSARSKTS